MDKNKKIVFITTSLYKIGGDAISTLRLANQAAKAGYDVEVVSLSKKAKQTIELDESVKVKHLRKLYHYELFPEETWNGNPFKLLLWPFLILRWVYFFFIGRLLIRGKIKRLYGRDAIYWPYNYMGYICCPRKLGVFHLHFCHERILGWTEPLLFKTFAVPRALVALTKHDQEVFQKKWPKRQIYYVGNSIDNKANEEPKYNNNKLVFLGRICGQKRIKHLIKFVKELNNKDVDFTFDFWGDKGSEAKRYKRIVKRYKLNNVISFRGRTSTSHETLKQYDMICLDSSFEGFPNVFLEAIAAGCAVATTNYSTSTTPSLLNVAITADNGKELANSVAIYLRDKNKLNDLKLLNKKILREYSDENRLENLQYIIDNLR